jgi:predicted small secreted protein
MKRVLKKVVLFILIAFVVCNTAFLLTSCDTVLFREEEGPEGGQGEQGEQGDKGDKGPSVIIPGDDEDPDDPDSLTYYFYSQGVIIS